MEYSVPTVTLDDLRAFQARHFIIGDQDFHQVHQAEETWEEEQYHDQDDDGLGYYPDGVKRTLTDEQIAIFRHSEIQRLFHERKLKAEAEVDKSEHVSKEGTDEDTTMVDADTSPNSQSNSAKPQARSKDNQESTVDKRKHAYRQSEKSGQEDFGYEDSETPKPARPLPPGPTKTAFPPFQRRLVSYDD